jgi:hypothetical protein
MLRDVQTLQLIAMRPKLIDRHIAYVGQKSRKVVKCYFNSCGVEFGAIAGREYDKFCDGCG